MKPPIKTIECLYCGKPFTPKRRVKVVKFCSDKCRVNYWDETYPRMTTAQRIELMAKENAEVLRNTPY